MKAEHPVPPARPSVFLSVLIAALFVLSFIEVFALVAGGAVHSNDYKHLWAGTRILVEGGSPYDPQMMFIAARQYGLGAINPFVYLPATGLILSPLALAPFDWSALLWLAFNWVLVWVCVLWGPALLRLERPNLARLAGALFLVSALPFYRQVTAGQMNVVILGSLLFSLALLMRDRQVLAGVILGFAAAFKISPIFMLLPLLALRRWWSAGALLVSFAAFNLAAVVWFGFAVHLDAIPVLTRMGYGESTWAEFGMDFYRDPFNQSFNALFHHLFAENPYTTPVVDLGPRWANLLTLAVSLLMMAGYGLILWRSFRLIGAGGDADSGGNWNSFETIVYLIGALLMLLLPSLMWDHYAVQALLVLMWLAGARWGPLRAWEAGALAIAFYLLAFPWMHQAERWESGAGILLMSPRLWGTLILLLVAAIQGHELMQRRRLQKKTDETPAGASPVCYSMQDV